MNIKVGMLFYVLSLFLAFFSRKIFLDCLGAEFIGLTGMLMNIMSFLSVAEFGIGISIAYFLYKPLQENNHKKINEVMSILAYLYRYIGFIIGGIGIFISMFFPWWFGNLTTGLFLVYFAFYAFLGNSMIGYIFNYRQLLLSANQKQYVVSAYFQTIGIVQSLTQILLAYYYRNLYLWVIVGVVFSFIGCLVLNYRINKEYPWLQINLKEGRENLKRYPEVLKRTKQVFISRIKDFILNRSDELLVGTFVSVTQVAFYGNYLIIINKLIYLVNILGDGMNAGVGNLIAEGNDQNTMKVFWELTAIRFFIMGMIIFPLLLFFQPLIACWVGPEYILSDIIVFLLVFNLFLRLQYATTYLFLRASGLYSDVWATWAELILNLTVTLAFAPFYGIVGILLGKIVSVFLFTVFWKPYYLFTEGFHKSVWKYWRTMFLYYGLFFAFVILSIFMKYLLLDNQIDSWLALIGYGIPITVLILLLYFIILFVSTKGMRYFVARKPLAYHIMNKLTFSVYL